MFHLCLISHVCCFLQGVLFAQAEAVKTSNDLIQLCLHEACRVYRDKLVEEKDMENYDATYIEIAKKFFDVSQDR